MYFLFVGALLTLLGFAFASAVGMIKYKEPVGTNFRGEHLASGRNYFPLTVSEMIHDPSSEESKCFFAFCIAGAICILISSYPWSLTNVYFGDDAGVPVNPRQLFFAEEDEKILKVPVLFFRQFLPPIGMILVICITVTSGERTFTEKLAATVHTIGAVIMIGGYIAFEVDALWYRAHYGHDDPPIHGGLRMKKCERKVRKVLIIFCAICAVGFGSCGAIHSSIIKKCVADKYACSCDETAEFVDTCADKWVLATEDDIDKLVADRRYDLLPEAVAAKQIGKKIMLENTASGYVLAIKQLNYWCEAFAGIAMVLSHLAIWFFCKERKIDLCEVMPEADHPDDYRRF